MNRIRDFNFLKASEIDTSSRATNTNSINTVVNSDKKMNKPVTPVTYSASMLQQLIFRHVCIQIHRNSHSKAQSYASVERK